MNPSGVVIDSRTLSLAWEEPQEEDRNGIIRQYHINVTEVNTRRQFQVVSTTTSISISSLHPDYTYQWTVAAFTIGLGPFSTSETISTPEDGGLMTEFYDLLHSFISCIDITVPTGAPQMLTVAETDVTNISLTWQPPLLEDRNGIIQGYIVRVLSISGAPDTREITTTYMNITITSLTPYTVYECVVSAYTAVGTGPSSNILLARTQPTSYC